MLFEQETKFSLFATASPHISRAISTAAGFTSISPIVCDCDALALHILKASSLKEARSNLKCEYVQGSSGVAIVYS